MSGNKDNEKKKTIEDLLKMLSMSQELNKDLPKDMNDYKFWKTQPVPRFDEKIVQEGPIDKAKTPADIPDEPYKLLGEFEWHDLDINNKAELDELYQLLHEHYVEDKDATFRFNYPPGFCEWGMKPPGWKREWHLGVRVKLTKKLVGFISAIPTTLRVHGNVIRSVEINFLVVHKQLRGKRLLPVLIKEITRRVNKHDIWFALHTAGVVLPSPISVCRYNHRPINWTKLYEVGFSHLPQGATKAQMVAKYALNNETKTTGLRPIKSEDIDQVYKLFNEYQKRFEIIQEFDLEEFKHWILSKESVVYSYVVEGDDGRITDFFSFFLLPFSVLNNAQHDQLNIAYLFYYATESQDSGKRLTELMSDALVLAKNLKIDVFNALTCQENNLFLSPLKFSQGDGFLNFYLFNYRCKAINGGIDRETKEIDFNNTSGVGVVLL